MKFASKGPSERALVFLIGAVHFINVVDFMIVMPLGPDFALSLGIPTSEMGLIGGSYMAAAAIAGILGSLFLDRFDRRRALLVAMVGLVVATALGGLAVGMKSLVAARVIAGTFGGPATSISLAIISDGIPPERRGKGVAGVMLAFSIASVVGVPAALELARIGGWRLPFFVVATVGLGVTLLAVSKLPSMRSHLETKTHERSAARVNLWRRTEAFLALATNAGIMISVFIVVPNIATYFVYNTGFPRERLSFLYLAGGVASFIAMRFSGRLVDRFGPPKMAAIATMTYAAGVLSGFLGSEPVIPAVLVFVLLMTSGSLRGVALHTVSTQIPLADERAAYMSSQSAVQHIAASTGAFLSAQMLHEMSDHKIAGMSNVAMASVILSIPVPIFLAIASKRLADRRRPDASDVAGSTV